MFTVNIQPPENCYVSEEVNVQLVEIPVHIMDNRDASENDIVLFFAVPVDTTREDIVGECKTICNHLGFSYLGCGEPLRRTYKFDAMELFLRQ